MNKPKLKKIDFDKDEISVWLDNEGHIKYSKEDEKIWESIFAPEDPDSAWEHNDIGPAEDNLSEYALTWIEWYLNTPVKEIAKEDFHKELLGHEEAVSTPS